MSNNTQNPFSLIHDTVDASMLNKRAELMLSLRNYLQSGIEAEPELRKRMGISQPRYSNLINGHIDLFSLDMLIKLSLRLGLPVSLSFN